MKELILQRRGSVLYPFDPESAKQMKTFYEFQPIRAQCSGIKKPRSYQQLKAYWASCQIIADHFDKFEDKEAVDFETKVQLKFFDRFTVMGDKVVVEVCSISYASLEHAKANGYFDRAFTLHARWLGVPKEELLKEAEKRAA